jgi:uncharacterized Zn-binding protein involved in type VI secretion
MKWPALGVALLCLCILQFPAPAFGVDPPAAGGTNVALGKTVIAATNTGQYSSAPSVIVDGETGGSVWWSFQGGSYNEQRFVLDLGAVYTIERINIEILATWGFSLSASTDGSTFTERHSGTSSGDVSIGDNYFNGLQSLASATPYEARYIKYHGYANWNQYVGIGEIEVFGQAPLLLLELTYPVGASPRVFTEGWTFGARAVRKVEGGSDEDLSSQVKWSGTGTFYPNAGTRSAPIFNAEGTNTITLSVETGGSTTTRDFSVQAVSPAGYARLSDEAFTPADSHGAIADPLPALGPITGGSPTVLIKGLPAARAGDPGIHRTCSGPNIFTIASGDPSVLIDGRPAARIGDPTAHCGGMGNIRGPKHSGAGAKSKQLASASLSEALRTPLAASGTLSGWVVDPAGNPIEGLRVWIMGPTGMDPATVETDADGAYAFTGLTDGSYRVYFSNVSIRTVGGQVRVASESYAPQWYHDRPGYAGADGIAVTAETPVVDINAQMDNAGSIAGRITDSTGSPVEKVRVTAYSDASFAFSWSWTGSDGTYAVGGLPDGSYRLWIEDSASRFVPFWYPDKLSREAAQAVAISGANGVEGIDAVLAMGGTISGTVIDLGTGSGIPGVTVQAVALSGGPGALAETAADGAYRITGLADGAYKVRFIAENLGYAGFWHAGQKNWDSAASITIASAAEIANIDASMEAMTLADLLSLLQIVSGMMPAEPFFHIQDLDGDGRIGLPEAIYILQKVSDLRP